MIDETLSRAVRDFVGVTVPARRYEQLPAEVPRERIDGILAIVDSEGPGSEDLWEWGDRTAERVRQAHPELSEDAVHAIESSMSQLTKAVTAGREDASTFASSSSTAALRSVRAL